MSHANNEEYEIDMRRQKVAGMYLRSMTMRQIALELDCSAATIHSDIKAVREELRSEAVKDMATLKAVELAKIADVDSEAWQAWERSKDVTKIAAMIAAAAETGKREAIEDAVERVLGQQVGDPAYLNVLMKCSEKRSKIQGTDAPFKHSETDPDGNELSDDVRRSRLLEAIAFARAIGSDGGQRDADATGGDSNAGADGP